MKCCGCLKDFYLKHIILTYIELLKAVSRVSGFILLNIFIVLINSIIRSMACDEKGDACLHDWF